jgi:chemotaxis protein methyltransferase CheR
MGCTQEAIDALRRALYLEPRQVLAHFMLGNLLRQRGEQEQSSRCARNALRLLRGLPGDEVLPESGGLTVQRLTEIIGSTFACPAEGEIP